MKYLSVFALVVFATVISEGTAVSILRHPQTKTVPAGGTVVFECRGDGEMGWYVDEQYVWSDYRDELEEDGFDFHTNHQPTYTHLRMTVPVINSRNGTKIQCEAYSPGNPAYSNIAWLWIIALPLPPNVSLELTSWNTMMLSWNAPFTAEGFPILKYIVYTTNSSTGETSQTDVYPTDGSETHTVVDTPTSCHSLSFEVVAESSAGTSSPGLASGGLPVAVEEFQVDISVVLSLNLVPHATISFHLPEVCSDVSGEKATYILMVKGQSGELIYRVALEYHESILVEETLTVETCISYSVNVTVFVPSFPELGSHTNTSQFHVQIDCSESQAVPVSTQSHSTESQAVPVSTQSHSTESQAVPVSTQSQTDRSLHSRGSESSSKIVFTPDNTTSEGPSVASGSDWPVIALSVLAGVVLLVLVVVMTGVCAVFVQRRRKTATSSTHMISNPLYEGATPLYDVIPESYCHVRLQEQSPEDSRYATTPLPMSYLLDSGISECGDDRQLCGEEQFQDTEKEKEDCYVCMQSANVL